MSVDKKALAAELEQLLAELEQISQQAAKETTPEDSAWLEEMRQALQSAQQEIVTIQQESLTVAPSKELAPQPVKAGSDAPVKAGADNHKDTTPEKEKVKEEEEPELVEAEEEEEKPTLEIEVSDGVTLSTDGEGVKLAGEDEDEGLSASLEISKQKIAAEVSKKWSILDYTSPGIPLILPWLQLEFGLKLEAELKAAAEYAVKEGAMQLGVEASFLGEGSVGLVINLAVVKCGVKAALEATAKAAGFIRVVNERPQLNFDGISGKLDMAFKVFIKAADWMISVYTTFGGDEDDLTWEKEFGRLNLLNFTVPGYKNGKMVGELKIEAGDDAKPFAAQIDAAVGTIKAIYDGCVMVFEWIGETLSTIVDFIADCLDALGEALLATISPAAWLEMKKKAAQDELFKSAVLEAVKTIKRNKKAILKLSKEADEIARYKMLIGMVQREPLVTKVWDQIYKAENMDAAKDTIDQIAVNIKGFHIKPLKDKFYLGGNAELLLSVDSDRTFPVGAFVVGILCDGKEVAKRGYSGTVNTGHWEKPFTLTLPATFAGATATSKWECFAKLDIEGELKDQYAKNSIKVYKSTAPTVTPISVTKLAARLKMDKTQYIVGASPSDQMDVTLEIDIPAEADASQITEVMIALVFNNKEIAVELIPNVQVKSGQRNTFVIKDIILPGREDAIKHTYAPTSFGGVWMVKAAVNVKTKGVIPIAAELLNVAFPTK